jgi:hypothetical protein
MPERFLLALYETAPVACGGDLDDGSGCRRERRIL